MKWLSVLVLFWSSYVLSATYPWPLKEFKIGHTFNSYQKIDGTKAYFHHGLDIVSEKNANVFVSAGGLVKRIGSYGDPDDELYYEVVIEDDQKNLWKYHHLDEYKISPEIKSAYKNQTRVESGIFIGKLVIWPYKMQGKPFHHLHLDVLGPGNIYLNPMDLLEPLPDHTAPEIKNIQVIKLKTGYTLGLETFDTIDNSDFYHPPHLIEISVDHDSFRTVWDFSKLPGGNDKYKLVEDFYVPKLTQGDYDNRKYVINLGFDKLNLFQFPTTPGVHHIKVLVYDYNNNQSQIDFQWEIR